MPTHGSGISSSGGGGGASEVNLSEVDGQTVATGMGSSSGGTQRVVLSADDMQSLGVDTVGADTYATVKTPTANANHIKVTNAGMNGAIISLDNGATDHFVLLGGEVNCLDQVSIRSGVPIQAKNLVPGSNYTDLYISIW